MRAVLMAAFLAPATALCAERVACEARVGPQMKPRDELYWPPAPSAGQGGDRSVGQPGYLAVPGLQPPRREVVDDESADGQAVGRARDMASPPSSEAGATFESRWPR